MEEKNEQKNIKFGGNTASGVAGVLGGVCFAVFVSWILLLHGQPLGSSILTILVSVAVIGGGLIALTAVFFAIVMPSSVPHEAPRDKWEKYQDKEKE